MEDLPISDIESNSSWWNSHEDLYLYFLSGLFVLSFIIPIFLAIRLHGATANYESEGDALFANALQVKAPGTFIKVHGEALNPVRDKDFLIVSWFKVDSLPASGKLVLLSKLDDKVRNLPGYLLGINRDGDVIRPTVYWQNAAGEGRWFSFAELPLPPKSWCMLAVSFRKNKYLGMHGAVAIDSKPPELQLLGGYKLETPVLPETKADLLIGAFANSYFRGKIGPVSVISTEKLSGNLKKILRQIINSPTDIPDFFNESDVIVWSVDGRAERLASGVSFEIFTRGRKVK